MFKLAVAANALFNVALVGAESGLIESAHEEVADEDFERRLQSTAAPTPAPWSFTWAPTPANYWTTECTTSDADGDAYADKLYGGSFAGVAIGAICVTAISLPLCCGYTVGQKAGGYEIYNLIASVVLLLSPLAGMLPFIGSMTASDSFVEEICSADGCECTQETKDTLKGFLTTFGAIAAYTVAFGWLAALLAGLGQCFACCACCACCGPIKAYQENLKNGGGVVVGQPVAAGAKE